MQSLSEYTKISVLKFTLFNLEKSFASKLVPWKNVFQQLAKTCQPAKCHTQLWCADGMNISQWLMMKTYANKQYLAHTSRITRQPLSQYGLMK